MQHSWEDGYAKNHTPRHSGRTGQDYVSKDRFAIIMKAVYGLVMRK